MSDGFHLSDEEIQIVGKALAHFSTFLAEDAAKITNNGDLPELVRQAAYEIYNREIEPISKLQIRLAQELGMPNMPA